MAPGCVDRSWQEAVGLGVPLCLNYTQIDNTTRINLDFYPQITEENSLIEKVFLGIPNLILVQINVMIFRKNIFFTL